MQPEELDEAILVARAQHSDESAYAELVRRHGTRVYNLALRLLPNPQDAEDMAQEAFVRAWLALPTFRGDAAFGTWLYRITTNLCYNRLPKLRVALQALTPEESADWPDDRPLPESRLLSNEAKETLYAAVDALPDHYRLLIQLRHMQGLPYQEIATITGMPLGTVKTGLHRAHRRLRDALTVSETPS
ncbi:MAG: sigma-70 family RNA polymerase sigma factor [Chloroflexota bacterium]